MLNTSWAVVLFEVSACSLSVTMQCRPSPCCSGTSTTSKAALSSRSVHLAPTLMQKLSAGPKMSPSRYAYLCGLVVSAADAQHR